MNITRILGFFFFQAEDGIRAPLVTGVQTCALPISCSRRTWSAISLASRCSTRSPRRSGARREIGRASCREKSVDLGGRRIIKKKKKKKSETQRGEVEEIEPESKIII